MSRAGVFVDSVIAPTFQLALAQILQMPGISGLPNNCILLEFERENTDDEIDEVIQGARLAAEFTLQCPHPPFNRLPLRLQVFYPYLGD